MTVEELIAELSELPGYHQVVAKTLDEDGDWVYVPIVAVTQRTTPSGSQGVIACAG